MACLTVLTERGDLPSGTTVLVMGVPAHMDQWLAVADPTFAVGQICNQTIMVEGVILGHDGSFLKNIKGCLRGVQTIPIHTPLRISVTEEGRVPHEVYAGVALRAQGTKLDGSILIVAMIADARRWLGDGHLAATITWDQTASHGVQTIEMIVLGFVTIRDEHGDIFDIHG